METAHRFGGPARISARSSTFPGTYGGIICDGPIDEEETTSLYDIARRDGITSLRGCTSPLDENVARLLLPPEIKSTSDFTHLLRIDRPYPEVVAGFSETNRRNIRKGKRSGIEVRLASSLDDIREYFLLYASTVRRWEDEPAIRFDWPLFRNCFDLASENPDNIRFWMATLDEQPIAGACIFYWNSHVVYWHGASLSEHLDKRPNNVLFDHIIRDAVDGGFAYFDFNPSGGHEGVARFKASFGAEQVEIRRWRYQSPVFTLLDGLRGLTGRSSRSTAPPSKHEQK